MASFFETVQAAVVSALRTSSEAGLFGERALGHDQIGVMATPSLVGQATQARAIQRQLEGQAGQTAANPEGLAAPALQLHAHDHVAAAHRGAASPTIPGQGAHAGVTGGAVAHAGKSVALPHTLYIQREHMDNQQYLPAHLQMIQQWARDHGQDIKSVLPLLVKDMEPRLWVMRHIEDKGEKFDFEAFSDAFVRYTVGDVRDRAVVALEELMTGLIRQGQDEPIAKYAERFAQRARVLQPSESERSLCMYFLRGMNAELRGHCRLTPGNQEWENLKELMQFSYGAEQRWQPHRAKPHPPVSSSQGKRGRGGADPGPSAAVAAVSAAGGDEASPAAKKRKTEKGRKQELPPGALIMVGCKGTPYKAPEAQYKTLPLEGRCDVYGTDKDTFPWSEAIKNELRLWGLCYYCRRVRHEATKCADKIESDRVKAAKAAAGR